MIPHFKQNELVLFVWLKPKVKIKFYSNCINFVPSTSYYDKFQFTFMPLWLKLIRIFYFGYLFRDKVKNKKLMKKPWNIFEIWLLLNPWKLKYPASRANSMSWWNSARNFQGPKTPVTRRGFKLGIFNMYRSYLDLLCHMPCTISVLPSFSWSML